MKKFIAVALMSTALVACEKIDTGKVGVSTTFGQVKQQTLTPGVYQSISQSIYEIEAREIAVEINNLTPKSSDNITFSDVDVTVYYHIIKDNAHVSFSKFSNDMMINKSGDYVIGNEYVSRSSRESVYKAFSRQSFDKAHLNRELISNSIRDELQKIFKEDGNLFNVTNVIVRNIITDPALEESIRKSAQLEFEIRAKIQANELTKAEAERQKTEANGQAAANRIITESLTPILIELRRIESMTSFAKGGTHTVVIPHNQQMMITTGK